MERMPNLEEDDDDDEDLEDFERKVQISDTVTMFPHRRMSDHGNIFKGVISTHLMDETCVVKITPQADKVNKEAIALHKIGSHSNVISFIEYGLLPRQDHFMEFQYIVVEKCHDLNLRQYKLSRNKTSILDDSEWGLNVCEQIIDGMKFIHEKSIVHKDLKPSNILLSRDLKTVKIADFDSSQELKTMSSKVFCETMFGTLGYRPPESFGKAYISLKTDIFSMGALFYFILSNGENPFGHKEDLWDFNAINGIIDLSNLIVSNRDDTKHLLERMLRTERCKRPSIWKVAHHPCWSGVKVKYDFEYDFDDEIDDCDVIVSEKKTRIPENAEEEGASKWKLAIKLLDSRRKRENILVIFDRERQSLLQLDTYLHVIHPTEDWNDEMKKGYFTTVSLESHIYVLLKTKSMYRLKYFDVTPTWEKMADMIDDDLDVLPQAVAISGTIYVIGGTYGTAKHYHNYQHVSRYRPATNTWKRLEGKRWNMRDAALAVANQQLYCIGGQIYNYEVIKNVEICDLVTGEWGEVAPLNEARYSAAGASYKDNIFVFGGLDNMKTELNSVEKYDPKSNQWTIVKPMTQPRSSLSFRCHVIKEKIYAVGGTQPSETIEYYDVNNDEWTTVNVKSFFMGIYSSVIVTKCA